VRGSLPPKSSVSSAIQGTEFLEEGNFYFHQHIAYENGPKKKSGGTFYGSIFSTDFVLLYASPSGGYYLEISKVGREGKKMAKTNERQ